MLFYRELSPADLFRILAAVAGTPLRSRLSSPVLDSTDGCLPREGVPQKLTELFLSVSSEPWAILLMVNVLLLILGCLMETTALLVILTPVLMDLISKVGIDPVHFGVVLTLNLMIGLLTPPVGMTLYVMVSLTGVSVTDFTRECAIFMLVLVVVLGLITYVPGLVTFLPHLIMGK